MKIGSIASVMASSAMLWTDAVVGAGSGQSASFGPAM